MPIQVQTTGSIYEVERELRSLEAQYGMSSAAFAVHPSVDDVVPEFDAIEWSFLLMQKQTLEEDRCSSATVFRGDCITEISDVEVREIYELIAA